VLAYGAEPYLEAAVRAVLDSTGVALSVVVVDNGCTSDAVGKVAELDGVSVLRPGTNTGYTGGCRLGAAEATGEYLAFVNSDAIVAEDALYRLVAVAAEPGVGLAMGSIRMGTDPDVINTAGNPLHYAGMSWAGGCYEPASRYAVRRQVTCGSGCCFVIRTERWRELGGFAEEYFAYHEDSDLSLRLWRRGATVEYVPDAVVRHHYEFSRNELKSYLLERNRLVLLLTGYQLHTLLILSPVLLLTEVAMLTAAVAGGWGRAKPRGWAWIWRNRSWVRARRRLLQSERTVPDRELLGRLTPRFNPPNLEAPPGLWAYNAASVAWWALARRVI
jgi:GT2 family glycosyltransferase